jgi:hypothetical protein
MPLVRSWATTRRDQERKEAMKIRTRLVALLMLVIPTIASAHHGSGISYDVAHLWSTWATITEFNYKNPHPSMTLDRQVKDGKVEHWTTELLTSPAQLSRAGWTKGRSEQALKPGTRLKLWIGTARVGGTSGIVMHLEDEKGNEILQSIAGPSAAPKAVDMDGVPMGLQPTGADKLVPAGQTEQ